MSTSRLVLDNAELWIGDGSTYSGYVTICDGLIETVAPGRYSGHDPVINLEGQALSPGLIDLMVLGGFNKGILHDDPKEIARQYVHHGVTSCQFSGGMLPWEQIQRVARNVRDAMQRDATDACRVLGLYMEGPFILPHRAGGALSINALLPTRDCVSRIIDEFVDVVRMINVSPGLEGDTEAIRQLRAGGMIISMAHSDAPADRVLRCVEAGTSVLGHVWNNNHGLIGDSGVQQPTIEHVALTDERVRTIHLICDGTHVHPVMINLVLRSRGLEAICLVTDCNQRSGCPDGRFVRDDGQEFYKKEGVCRRVKDNALAGSATFLDEGLRNFIKFTGKPPHEAIRTVTLNPAESLGMENEIGVIASGRTADLVAWDQKMRIAHIWRKGVECEVACEEFSEVTRDLISSV